MAMKRKNLPEVVPQVFEHEQFGKIRVVIIDGKPWFVAKDVCRALALENVTKALYPLADDEKNTFTISKGIVGNPKMRFVNEPGLYRLIFMSRKPEAEKFKRWVFHEVLPSIRETGIYSLPKKKKKELPQLPPGLLNDDPTDFGNVARLETFLEEQGIEYDYELVPEVVKGEGGKPIMRYNFKLVIK